MDSVVNCECIVVNGSFCTSESSLNSIVDIHLSKFGNIEIEISILKGLGENINNLMSKSNEKQLKEFVLKLFTNDVRIYLHVFGSFVEPGIESDLPCGLIITICNCW